MYIYRRVRILVGYRLCIYVVHIISFGIHGHFGLLQLCTSYVVGNSHNNPFACALYPVCRYLIKATKIHNAA